MMALHGAIGAMRGRAVLSMGDDVFVHNTLGASPNDKHEHVSLIVAVSGVMLESVQTSSDALGKTLVIIGCVLVCIPVLLFFAGASYPSERKPRVPNQKAQEDTFSHCPDSPLPPSSKHQAQTNDPVTEVDKNVDSPRRGTSQLTVESPSLVARPSPRCAQPAQPQDWDGQDSNAQGTTRSDLSPYSSLCPGLVVRQPGGITLAMTGLIAPYRQSEVIEFKRFEGTKDTVARAIISESSDGGGVILESALRLPIVFLHTEHAVGARDGSPPSNRYITVSRAVEQVGAGNEHTRLFSTIQADGSGEGVIMWQGAASDKVVLLAVRIHGDGRVANIVDANGRLLATTEAREHEPGSRPMRWLHVASGVDTTIILIALIASFKLQ